MAERLPWFKLFAADYLLDSDVDSMPREAEGLLLRMWCMCHIEGSCPAEPEELARKTRCSLQYVLQYKRHCQLLFELRDGRLYSRRMEEEKRRSEQARENASKRYAQSKQSSSESGSANGNANGSAIRTAQSQSQSQNQGHSQNQKRGADAPTRARQMPDGFTPKPSHSNLAAELGIDLGKAFPHFKDHHLSKGNTFKDWDRALNSWLRREQKLSRGNLHANLNRAEQRQADNLAACAAVKRDLGLVG
jgi:uncharacterized protein YdaU (DUF1376 family)